MSSDWPIVSDAGQPNTRVAASFQNTISPDGSAITTASASCSISAASAASSGLVPISSCLSRSDAYLKPQVP